MCQEKYNKKAVRFKLEQIMESLLNTSKWDLNNAYNPALTANMIEKHWVQGNIKQHIVSLIEKEIVMGCPDFDLEEEKKKRKFQDMIIESFFKQFESSLFIGRVDPRKKMEVQRFLADTISTIYNHAQQ